MVEPGRYFRLAIILGGAALPTGCAFVPKERLDDCHKQCQNLQVETSQLKDSVLKLRATNQDLAHRGIEDANRVRTLDERNQQLERSVIAYQEERDRLSGAFEQFKRQLIAAGDRPPSAMLDRFQEFSRSHRGFTFDPESRVAAFPTESLYQAGSADWTPDALPLLRDFAALLAPAYARNLTVRVVAETADPAVRLTSLDTTSVPAPEALARARAKRLRDVLIEQAMLDPARIAVAGEDLADQPATDSNQPISANTVLEIHLRPTARAALRETPALTSAEDANQAPSSQVLENAPQSLPQ